jgi:hypothetical protein
MLVPKIMKLRVSDLPITKFITQYSQYLVTWAPAICTSLLEPIYVTRRVTLVYKAEKRNILNYLLDCLQQVCKGTLGSYFLIIDTEHRYISQTTTMARPQFAGEEDDLQIRRVAANILNRQSVPLQNGWPSDLRFGKGSNTSL